MRKITLLLALSILFSCSNVQKGFTHCFILTFASEKERDIYLPHPEHKALGDAIGPYLDDVMVLDFFVNK